MKNNKFNDFLRYTSSFYQVLSKPAKVNSLPVHIHVELTNMCNLSCKMCPRSNKNFKS